jgi:hypothetical protein
VITRFFPLRSDLDEYFAQYPTELARILRARRGRPFQKWLHYFEIYDRHFGRFRGKPVHFLEIGVNQGGSLQLWRAYLGPQATIYGADIDPTARAMAAEGFQIHIGDQADPAFLARLKAAIPKLDVVLDDGGHHMHQLLASFQILYPHLSADGVYFCEDLHTRYMKNYGGGYRKPGMFIERSKGWIDQLNAWYSEEDAFRLDGFGRSTWSMSYYDSALVIEKRPWRQPMIVNAGAAQPVSFAARPR